MRSWLYTPGNNPKMIINAPLYGADGLVFDLEDAVAADQKEEARYLLAQAFSDEIIPAAVSAVRINGMESLYWQEDLCELIPAGVRMIRIPKIEKPEEVREICSFIGSLEKQEGKPIGSVKIHCLLETPLGVENAFALGGSSPRITTYCFGAEDYCLAVGINREKALYPLDYPRSRITSAAGAFGYGTSDSVWGFLNNPDGLEEDALRSYRLGFEGKSVIHPDQIETVNRIYSPSEEDISRAGRILKTAANMSGGAASVDGQMIDRPVIRKAERILETARTFNTQDSNHDK
jgi:citrate lyase subunit beta / citryl-CoA lyase